MNKKLFFLFIIISTLLIAIGQLQFSQSHKQEGVEVFSIITLNPALLIGFLSYVLGAGLFFYMLKFAPLTNVYPLFALSYVWVAIGGILLLQEVISLEKIIGTATIIAGVICINKGGS